MISQLFPGDVLTETNFNKQGFNSGLMNMGCSLSVLKESSDSSGMTLSSAFRHLPLGDQTADCSKIKGFRAGCRFDSGLSITSPHTLGKVMNSESQLRKKNTTYNTRHF